jgi:hypothetical protein
MSNPYRYEPLYMFAKRMKNQKIAVRMDEALEDTEIEINNEPPEPDDDNLPEEDEEGN